MLEERERLTMESQRVETMIDHHLDTIVPPPVRRPVGPVEPYQRLVVNPFLMAALWVAGILIIRLGLQRQSLFLFFTGIALLPGALPFLQFHCLDCWHTGFLLRHRRHTCEAVVRRCSNDEERRFQWLSVGTQTLAWFYVLPWVLLLLFALVASWK
jgi:hypothetical protein